MLEPVIYTQIPRTDPALLVEAAKYPVADLHEGVGIHGGRTCLMNPSMRPITPHLRVVGPAITVYSYPGDNLMMHKALYLAQPGQVLVITNGGGAQGALWGDLAAIYAQRKKLGGVVIDGNIRDSEALLQMKDPVWCTGIWAGHAERRTVGAINVPMVCAGTLVNPGDIIAADDDGVLVIPRRHLAAAIEVARARKLKEVDTKRRLDAGEALHDQASIDAILAANGVKIRDTTWQQDEAAHEAEQDAATKR